MRAIGIFLKFLIVNALKIYVQYILSHSQGQFERMFEIKANS
jgi:hypothetical protein